MYPLGNYMNKKNVFFAFLWLFLCLHAMYLEKSPADFLREVFAVCPVPVTRSETWTKTVDVFIRSVKKRYALYTSICGITGSETECRFQWCKRRGRLQTSLVVRTHFSWKLNFKPQNALKCLKYPPSKNNDMASYALYTSICGITGSETECRFQWCKRRGRLQTSLVVRTHFSWKLNFKPQNALKCLKYPPSNWSWICTLSNEVWG